MKKERFIQLLIGTVSLVGFIILGEIGLDRTNRMLPLKLDPSLLGTSLLSIVLIFLVVYFILKKWKNKRYFLAPIFIGPIALAILSVVTSFEPGSGPMRSSETLTIKELASKNRELMLPLFFKNSEKSLSKKLTKDFLNRFNTLNSCTHDTIIVVGFASSREFDKDNEFNNRKLANDRAKYVEGLLKSYSDSPIVVHEWKSLVDMENSVRIADRTVDINNELIPEKEALNRRVEIIWKNVNCSIFKE